MKKRSICKVSLLILALLIFPGISGNNLKSADAATDCQTCKRIKKDTFGCANKAIFDRVLTFIAQEDQQAAAQLVTMNCTLLPQGTLIHVDSYKFMSGEAQIHPHGSAQSLWVISNMVGK